MENDVLMQYQLDFVKKYINESIDDEDDANIARLYDTFNILDIEKFPIMESTMMKKYKEIIDAKMTEIYLQNNTVHWESDVAPYFTDKEIMGEQLLRHFNEHFHRMGAGDHYSNFYRVDPEIFRNRVEEIQTKMKQTEDPDEIKKLTDALVGIGWNPEVEYTAENAYKARSRVISKYNEELKDFYFIDCTNLIKYYNETSVNENFTGNNFICITVTEDNKHSCRINRLEESSTPADYYVIYMNDISKFNEATYITFNDLILENYPFKIPSNVIAARATRRLYDEAGIGAKIRDKRPIIKKVYSGVFDEDVSYALNSFVRSTSKTIFTPQIVDGYASSQSYYAENMIY